MKRAYAIILMVSLVLVGGFASRTLGWELQCNRLGISLLRASKQSISPVVQPKSFNCPHFTGTVVREAVRRQELDTARDILAVAREQSPGEPSVLYAEGEIALAEGDIARTVTAWQRARAADALRKLGLQLMLARKWDDAEITYQAVLALKPDDVDALINLARAIWRARQDMAALELFTRARTLEPDNLAAWLGIAGVYRDQGSEEEARYWYTLVTQRFPDSPLSWLALGRFELAFCGRPAAAEPYVRRAIELDPALAEAHALLGQYYYWKKDLAEAMAELELATQLDGSDPLFHQVLGDVYLDAGKLTQARTEYQAVITLGGDERYAREQLSQMESSAP